MWSLYGDQSKGVAIQTTIDQLIQGIKPFRLKSNYQYENQYYGEIKYINLKNSRLPLLGQGGDIKRFFHKHKVFEFEKEFRILISLITASEYGAYQSEKGIFVDFEPTILVDTIYFGPNCNPEDITLIRQVCDEVSIAPKFKNSSLLGTPMYI